jgi:hypothetical protein
MLFRVGRQSNIVTSLWSPSKACKLKGYLWERRETSSKSRAESHGKEISLWADLRSEI